MSSALNMDQVAMEARRQLAVEQEAARRAAFENQRRIDRELAEIAARERDARIAFEAERIEAQRRAEEAILVAKAKAEKEAFDAAVAAKKEEMRNRPAIEVLRAELEELRAELHGEFNVVRQATPWADPIQEVRAQMNARPWDTGIGSLRGQMDTLSASVAEIKSLLKKPSRQVSVAFYSGMGGTAANAGNIGVANWNGNTPTLTLKYHIVPQNMYTAAGTQQTMQLTDTMAQVITVPEGHKVFVASATASASNPRSPQPDWRDLTHLYKAMLQSQ